ncbi:MAG: bacteriohemerythrin [Treponema sp.]|nr:bacteriohemerythrin [Treponema sp.]
MSNKNNEFIAWNGELSCGITLIDEQHRNLLDLVNEMFDNVTGDEVQEHNYFEKVAPEAVRYAKIHFSTEEKIMLVTNFKGYAEHKKEHDTFVNTISDIIFDFRAGKQFSLSVFALYLKDWVLSHIAFMDKQYIEYLRSVATRKKDGRLSVSL